MPTKDENQRITEWEEHAAAVVAGTPYSRDDNQQERDAFYGRMRIWNALFVMCMLILLASLGLALLASGLLGVEIPQNLAFLNGENHLVDIGKTDSWKNYFSGYWGIAKWVALSILITHIWVGSLIRSAHRKVVRFWNFMGSHSEEGRQSKWSVPRIPLSEKEAMLATTFRGFWLKATRGIAISPFGLRLFLSLILILLYPGLVYLGVFSSALV